MDLHGRIMNIQVDRAKLYEAIQDSLGRDGAHDMCELAYKLGHRDARHAAAELASCHPDPNPCPEDGCPRDGSAHVGCPCEPRTCETCGKEFQSCKCLIPTMDTDPPCHAWTSRPTQPVDVETVQETAERLIVEAELAWHMNPSDSLRKHIADFRAALDRIAGKEET